MTKYDSIPSNYTDSIRELRPCVRHILLYHK